MKKLITNLSFKDPKIQNLIGFAVMGALFSIIWITILTITQLL